MHPNQNALHTFFKSANVRRREAKSTDGLCRAAPDKIASHICGSVRGNIQTDGHTNTQTHIHTHTQIDRHAVYFST